MSLVSLLSDARERRAVKRAERAEFDELRRELAGYSTPAERLEIELLAQRSDQPGAQAVLAILDQLPTPSNRRSA